MNGESPSLNKASLRQSAKSIRNSLSPERRREAAEEMVHQLLLSLTPYHSVLSFSPLPGEIDSRSLNKHLMQEGKLCLLKEEEERWIPYRAVSELRHHPKYEMMEPTPKESLGEKVQATDVAIIPGLAFAPQGYRLGYGGGAL